MSRKEIPPEEKLKAVKLYLDEGESPARIEETYGVCDSTFRQWIRNYKSMGSDVFFLKKRKHYSSELKLKAVQEYLSGQGSLDDICSKNGIRSRSKLIVWIKSYNSYGTLKSSDIRRRAFMTKGRKTTLDERIEIVQYCIDHNYDYKETAEKYGISYQQARNYTAKYQDGGVDALEDRRGKRKDIDQMNELEKLRAENRLLKAEKEQAEMEVSFLKKLQEIEGRRG